MAICTILNSISVAELDVFKDKISMFACTSVQICTGLKQVLLGHQEVLRVQKCIVYVCFVNNYIYVHLEN